MPALRVASYNIHRCYGVDGEYRPDRIRQVLHELKAQVIALQEVESSPQHGELLDYLVEESDWQYIEGPTLLREAGRYGNAILSALPIERHELFDLSYKNREPRSAIDISVSYEQHSLRVIATHLGLIPSERRHQVRRLLDWIGSPEIDPEELTLLLGDLNEWSLWGRPLRWLRGWFGKVAAPATYPTRLPLFALDRIWANPKQYIKAVRTHRTHMARIASDHYPVVATLNW